LDERDAAVTLRSVDWADRRYGRDFDRLPDGDVASSAMRMADRDGVVSGVTIASATTRTSALISSGAS
jgi:hypothetical protein